MLKSMTGYGRCEDTIGDRTFLVEIRSLNGKQFEALLKIPQLLKPYEFDIRGLLSERLLRGQAARDPAWSRGLWPWIRLPWSC